ncbi:hypothetical protein CC2G_006628 [Coprinopsis cinerea AmutBmut pab1-1]|nr:hypothetical protein CC2G_006628 [Coprinopsis cinerea AmutBmut pab1-1]
MTLGFIVALLSTSLLTNAHAFVVQRDVTGTLTSFDPTPTPTATDCSRGTLYCPPFACPENFQYTYLPDYEWGYCVCAGCGPRTTVSGAPRPKETCAGNPDGFPQIRCPDGQEPAYTTSVSGPYSRCVAAGCFDVTATAPIPAPTASRGLH